MELEARLGRQLTTPEINLTRDAVRNMINKLAARFVVRQPELDLSHDDEGRDAQLISHEPASCAELAAASWGSWRIRALTNASARAHHILCDSESKALSLLKELTFGADLGQLAAEHSLCPSKGKGGDLGVFVPGDMATEFDTFVFDDAQPVGEPLGPVKTPFGYHLIIIDERTL